jgi:formylglycine-generating enzyme required for sulfatase activity
MKPNRHPARSPFLRAFALVIFLGLGAVCTWATEPEPKSPASALPQPLTSVFDLERPVENDVLVLADGEWLHGVVLNETVTLRTRWGSLPFPSRVLAGIDFGNRPGNLESVVTVNRNAFSGFVEEACFTLQSSAGNRIEVRREKVTRLIFHRRKAELDGLPSGRWIRLVNGDSFSGQVITDPLLFTVTNAQIKISPQDIQSLAFTQGTNSKVAIRLRNGSTLQGRLAGDDLSIKLDIGPPIDLVVNRIDRIADRLDESLDPWAAAQPPASAISAVPFAARNEATNLPGMVWIPAGEFTLGSPSNEVGRNQDEGPQTTVVIPHGFWMGKCEVTQAEYQALMGTNPSNITDDLQRPVERVNWQETMEYCDRLTQRAQTAGRLPEGYYFRLPTEAEWEYACRAGTTTRFSFGDDKGYARLADYAWFMANSDSMTHPVGVKQPNPWGLFDMHGNVWEWCLDRWESSLPGGRVTNNAVAGEGSLRGARGGSWLYDGRACRSANRDDYSPSNRCSDLGFRVVLAPIQQ